MLTSSQKGNLIESHVANMITLLSDGEIAASIPIVDDFGIDLLLTRKSKYNTLFFQIKSRFVTGKKNKNGCSFGVKKKGFSAHNRMYILCVYFNQQTEIIDTIWLIPSNEIESNCIGNLTHRIVASKSPISKDKWSKYKVTSKQLVDKILNLI